MTIILAERLIFLIDPIRRQFVEYRLNQIILFTNQDNLMKIKIVVLLSLLSVFLSNVCRGSPNKFPIIDAQFQKNQSHQYGEKYYYFNPQSNQNFFLLRLWGNSYQAGFAYGTLMREELHTNVRNIWKHYEETIEDVLGFIKKVPEKYQPKARAMGLKILQAALMANHYLTRPFVAKRYIDQYQGLSDGSGIPASTFIQLNMLPELLKAGCSILGTWGKATVNGDLIHLRALDWDKQSPINQFPTLVIYNLKQKGSHPFLNVAWAGFIGSLTGFGEYTGIGQQLRKQNPTKQNQTRLGKPWTYALRDVIQFSQTIQQALKNLQNTRRTCSIHVGLSNIKSNTFRLIKYSHKQFDVYDDKNFTFTPTHAQMDGVVSMPVHDDKGDACFNTLLLENYGKFDSQWITNTLAASHKTGDTQMATYNFNKKELLLQVSNATKVAFERPTIRIQLKEFFSFSDQEK